MRTGELQCSQIWCKQIVEKYESVLLCFSVCARACVFGSFLSSLFFVCFKSFHDYLITLVKQHKEKIKQDKTTFQKLTFYQNVDKQACDSSEAKEKN